MTMTLAARIDALAQLGDHLQGPDEYLEAVMHRTHFNNPWFTIENQQLAVQAIVHSFLQKEKLQAWAASYPLEEPAAPKRVGQVMAGNIPLVGFHDLVCTFVAGHRAIIKLSEKDRFLLPYLLKLLGNIDQRTENYFEITERLDNMDAVIATGSNNSSRYFEAYFGKYPHIIRRNRNAVAVLHGSETSDELHALGRDVFRYFGLGCRNVSKLYLPQGYDMQLLLERLHDFREIIRHDKYRNNFDYNLAMLMMNRTVHWNNGCIILSESPDIASRIAMLHFEYFSDEKKLVGNLQAQADEIQCVVSARSFAGLPTVPFGNAQSPTLHDYADGVDVMEFLRSL